MEARVVRRAARVDQNHAEIVQALRRSGAVVCDASRLGDGAPDLLVARGSVFKMFEVKTKTGKLRPSQEAFQRTWQGHYAVVRTVDDALREIGVIR